MAQGWRKPHNGPYGSPRGNPAMASKRTTGPTAQHTLCLRMVSESLLTRTTASGTIERFDTIEALQHKRSGKPW